jgi:pilus assembly protein CpaC
MIVVTPYLVRPVSPNQIVLPTDGYRAPTDGQRVIAGQSFDGKSGEQRALPHAASPRTIAPPAGKQSGRDQGVPSVPDAGFSVN